MSNELPYLPFFVGDFLVTVGTWPAERVGAYVLALFYQFEHGGLPADDEPEMARILHVSKPAARRIWIAIRSKYHKRSDGLWWNQRLEEVRAQARDKVAKATTRAKNGAAARWGKGVNNAQAIAAHANAQALLEQPTSNASQVKVSTEPPLPPSAEGGRRRLKKSLTSVAEMQQHARNQRVKALMATGMERNAAVREVFGS